MQTELHWLLDDFVSRVTDVQHAIILSNDGLRVAASGSLEREDAEHLSAVAAGFQSLAKGASLRFDGGAVRQTIVEMESALLFVTSAGNGSCLAVMSQMGTDAGLIAYEMARLVAGVGRHLTTQPRGAV
ncbi:roadblock/LC7 domain-containing protein [Sphaerisporangium perillae]|uniref:roadblock/LC7 domain-containing protein n=1 Tax=Sphaerisporangium perillae TaxID=2935860 RepID=UPI00200F0ED2|nr:roadblock/LC7 domain-containing protein [Sphaerisporangium perillae]